MPRHADDRSYLHLQLVGEDRTAQRRKQAHLSRNNRPNRGGRGAFGQQLHTATAGILEDQAQRRPLPAGIQPHLVFRIPLAKHAPMKTIIDLLGKAGLLVVSVEADRAVVVFQDDADVSAFQEAIQGYQQGPQAGINQQTGKPYQSTKYDLLEFIEPEGMRRWQRQDRIGARLAEQIGPHGADLEAQRLYILDVELWHTGSRESLLAGIAEVQRLIGDSAREGERLLDRYLGQGLVLVKVAVRGLRLDALLELDVVAHADIPPQPSFDALQARQATAHTFPAPPRPGRDGPRLCVIDSGIVSGHALLRNNIGHEAAILTQALSPADRCGHGTMVAGIAVFGDVRACYEAGTFASPITLYSARVLNDQNAFDDEKLIPNQLREAVAAFVVPPYNCRIFNISIGGDEPALGSGQRHQNIYAEALDEIAREYSVLLIVSAGNHRLVASASPAEGEAAYRHYPRQLLQPEARLCDFATAALALTVGAVAQYDTPTLVHGLAAQDILKPLARSHEPAPMTRVGPGVQGAIKPELVHFGGSLVFDPHAPRSIRPDDGTGVMSFHHKPTERLFSFMAGTSFAAPRVAHLAARLEWQLSSELGSAAHPNLLRAMLAASAHIPKAADVCLEKTGDKHASIKVCGYGLPDDDFVFSSWDRRVTLYAQDSLPLDHFRIYAVPIPEAFQQAKGERSITVALAFDPPVRGRRADYLGVEMGFALIRGKDLDSVHNAFRNLDPDEDIGQMIPPRYRITFLPSSRSPDGTYSRKKSTLQCGTHTFKRPDRDSYGDEYYLVVRTERKWAEIEEQGFAVVVSLAANDPQLYVQVQQRIQQRVQARMQL